MEKKRLSEAYEQGLLSEAQEDQLLKVAFQLLERERIKKVMREEAEVKIIPFQRNRWLVAAACILFGVIAWSFFREKPIPLQNPSIAQVKVTPKTLLKTMPAPSLYDEVLLDIPSKPTVDPAQAFKQAYNDKNYAQAAQLGEKLKETDVVFQINWGYSCLQAGDFKQAIPILEAAYQKGKMTREEPRWWLGLAHGLNGDSTIMKKYLREIEPEQAHYQEAQQILK
jgi:hypothetical protein